MGAPTDDWHDGWRLQWRGDPDSDAASDVVAAFERLIAHRTKPTRLKRWMLIAEHYDQLLAHAELNEAEGYPKLAAQYRATLERIDVAISNGKSAKQVLDLLFDEQAAKDALIACRRNRDDAEKRREARLRLYLVSGRWLDPDEEWRVDEARNRDSSSTISRVAARIVDRVKLC